MGYNWRMRFLVVILSVFFLSFTVGANAQEEEKLSFELMARAVIYAAQADEYNAYCDKESALAQSFLKTFESYSLPEQEMADLKELHSVNQSDTNRKLKEAGKPCNDVEFMLTRLRVMKELKNVSYELNGIDPATLPSDTIPELEGFLPKRAPPTTEL